MNKHRNTDRIAFSSGNHYGFPDLLPEMIPENPNGEFFLYQSGPLTHPRAGGAIVGFFTYDYRFQSAWDYPDRITNLLLGAGISCAIEPNFSVWADRPLIEQIHAVYRSRWCGRYWQEHGIPVIPALNWSDPSSYAWAFSGIPVGCPTVAVECRSCGSHREAFNAGLGAALDTIKPKRLMIYGNPETPWVQVPPGVSVQWIEPPTNKRFRAMKSGAG